MQYLLIYSSPNLLQAPKRPLPSPPLRGEGSGIYSLFEGGREGDLIGKGAGGWSVLSCTVDGGSVRHDCQLQVSPLEISAF